MSWYSLSSLAWENGEFAIGWSSKRSKRHLVKIDQDGSIRTCCGCDVEIKHLQSRPMLHMGETVTCKYCLQGYAVPTCPTCGRGMSWRKEDASFECPIIRGGTGWTLGCGSVLRGGPDYKDEWRVAFKVGSRLESVMDKRDRLQDHRHKVLQTAKGDPYGAHF